MKSKEYLCPDFKFIEVLTEHRYCGAELSAQPLNVSSGDPDNGDDVDEFDANPFRDGIWDNDELFS